MKTQSVEINENSNINSDREPFKPAIKLSKSDASSKGIIITLSFLVVLILFLMVGFIVYKSVPALHEVGLFKFVFSSHWKPSGTNAKFGILGIIGSTLMMLVISLLFAIPLTIFGSLYISEYLSPKIKKTVISLIQLLAGVPSVVFGLFALDQIGNIFVFFGAKTPGNMMTASFTLAFMALPTMMTLTIDGIASVPDGYRFASLGLGVTKERTTFNVILKAALPKMITAIIIGIARIIGETMAVIMIAGGSSAGINTGDGFSGFIFSSITTLAGTIGLEMLENSGKLHESALYAIGLVLFFLVIIINLIVLSFSKRRVKKVLAKNDEAEIITEGKKRYSSYQLKKIVNNYTDKKIGKKIESCILKFFMISSLYIILAFVFWLIITIMIKGLMGFSFGSFIRIGDNGSGIFATLFVTMLLVMATLTFAIPIALIVAIYLAVYANKKSFFTKIIRFSINILSSTPSIVYGAFGLSLFITALHIPMSIIAASLTMTFVVLPSMIIVFEDSINSVPESYGEAAFGMGLGKTKTLFKVILPSAFRGFATGIILTIARIFGEAAPIYLTLGTSVRMPGSGFFSSGATLTTEIYMLVSEGSGSRAMADAYMIALFTMIIIVLLNWLSRFISARLDSGFKKLTKAEYIAIIKKRFSKENINNKFRKTSSWFIGIGVSIGSLFNFKKWHREIKKNKAINNELKEIKKEVQKNGRAQKK